MNSEYQRNAENSGVDAADLEHAVIATFPPDCWAQHNVIVGVSGGPDSVALLEILWQLHSRHRGSRGKLIVSHFNYGLRGSESDLDETFVRILALKKNLECRVRRADKLIKPGGVGWEAYLRTLRYEYFRELAGEFGARYVALGHNQDDQVETILFRLLRGTSLNGLRGIPAIRPLTEQTSLARPLLRMPRSAVIRFLESLDAEYRIDSSNQTGSYTRNRIRHELLPLLSHSYSHDIRRRLLDLADDAAVAFDLLQSGATTSLNDACTFVAERHVHINGHRLNNVPPPVVRQMLVMVWQQLGWRQRDMRRRDWMALARYVTEENATACPSIHFPGGRIARKGSDGLVSIV